MKRIFWLIILAVATTVALSLFAGEPQGCTASAEDCLKKMHAKLSQVGWLGIETDKGEHGYAAVTSVLNGSPAQAAGFAVGDVLVAINGVPLGGEKTEALKKVKSTMTPGAEVAYTVKRQGSKVTLNARLGAMPETLIAQRIGEHMIKEHLTTTVASK